LITGSVLYPSIDLSRVQEPQNRPVMLDKSRDPESGVPILPRHISPRDKAEDRQANYQESIRPSAASIFTIFSDYSFSCSLTHLLRDTTSGSHAEPRVPNLLPTLPRTHLSRDPIPIR